MARNGGLLSSNGVVTAVELVVTALLGLWLTAGALMPVGAAAAARRRPCDSSTQKQDFQK